MIEPWAIMIEDNYGRKVESILVYGCWMNAYDHVPEDVIDWLRGHGFEISFKPVKLK